MVTVKERKVKGRTYVYVSASATYKGERKRFEKSIGPKDMDPEILERRIELYSLILEGKREFYLIALEIKNTKLNFLPSGYSIPLCFVRRTYQDFIKDLYPEELEKYQEEFNVRYVHHTTAIEGNTLSLKETSLVLDKGFAPSRKELREIHEIENYKQVLKLMKTYRGELNINFILKIHKLIQRNIDDNTAGNLRRIAIGIEGSKWEPPPAIDVEENLRSLIKWYDKNKKRINPFELAGIFHHKFLQIHPFVDGNGRVARELLNYILQKNKYPLLIIPVERREDYITNLEKADDGDTIPLLRFFVEVLVDDYIKVIVNLFNKIDVAIDKPNEEELIEINELKIWGLELILRTISEKIDDIDDQLVELISKFQLLRQD